MNWEHILTGVLTAFVALTVVRTLRSHERRRALHFDMHFDWSDRASDSNKEKSDGDEKVSAEGTTTGPLEHGRDQAPRRQDEQRGARDEGPGEPTGAGDRTPPSTRRRPGEGQDGETGTST